MAPTTFKGFEDFTSFGKEAYDAMLKANALFTKGVEDFSKELMAMTQTSIETASSHTKAILSAKSLKEVVDLNTELTKSSIEKMVATSTKLSELGMKVTTEAMAPISTRMMAA